MLKKLPDTREASEIPFEKVIFRNIEQHGLRKEDIRFLCMNNLHNVGFGSKSLYGKTREKALERFEAANNYAVHFKKLGAQNGDDEPVVLHGQPGPNTTWAGDNFAVELAQKHNPHVQNSENLAILLISPCNEVQKNLSSMMNHGRQPTQMFLYAPATGCQIIAYFLGKGNKATIG